ncbi:MAG: hypothetical protein U5N26_01595 [Candidatus Marinimicrobia bacterium]|nr:hypothetical protein [Candidatus Neomarinimicrobiota bacterium]
MRGNSVQLLPEAADASLNISYTNIYQDVSELETRAFDCAQLDNMESGDTLFIKHKNTLSYTTETEEGMTPGKTFYVLSAPLRFQPGRDLCRLPAENGRAQIHHCLE